MRVKVTVERVVEGHKWVEIDSVDNIYKYGFVENLETFETNYEWGVEGTILKEIRDENGSLIAGTYTDDDGRRHISGWSSGTLNKEY